MQLCSILGETRDSVTTRGVVDASWGGQGGADEDRDNRKKVHSDSPAVRVVLEQFISTLLNDVGIGKKESRLCYILMDTLSKTES